MPPSLPGRDVGREGLRFPRGVGGSWVRPWDGSGARVVPWPPSRGTYSKEVPEGGQEIYFCGKEKSQVALAALESWARLQVVGDCLGLDRGRPLRQAEVADTGFAVGGEQRAVSSRRALYPEQNPQVPPPLVPLAAHCCRHLCAVEGCGHGDCVPALPPTVGKAGQGDEDRWAHGAGSSLPSLCLWPCPPELPFLLRRGTAGRFVYSGKHPLLPSDGFSSAFSKCVLHSSLPALCRPCHPAGISQPISVLSVVGMEQGCLRR